MEATAKFDYEATADDELSFRRGERLKMLQTSGNWYKAELNGAQGLVPQNFIDIYLPSWYQEGFSRSDAQERLMSQPVGAFIIRGSQSTTPGEFSISVRHAESVQHFKVMRDSRGQYYLWSEKFTSLNQLVEHYKENSISKETQIFLREVHQQQRRSSEQLSPRCTAAPPSGPLPPVPRSPQRLHNATSSLQVRALYSFHAEETDELQFNAGDIITVLDRPNQTWWRGQLRGKMGLFPSNHTKPL